MVSVGLPDGLVRKSHVVTSRFLVVHKGSVEQSVDCNAKESAGNFKTHSCEGVRRAVCECEDRSEGVRRVVCV